MCIYNIRRKKLGSHDNNLSSFEQNRESIEGLSKSKALKTQPVSFGLNK